MPYRRRYRKSNTRRKFRKSLRRARKSYSRYRKPNTYRRTKVRLPTRVMPDYTLVKMKDSRVIILEAGNNPTDGTYSVSNSFISGNDIYNAWQFPNGDERAGPTGFDQWAAFYNNFIVHKSSVKVTPLYWITTTGDAPAPFQLTVTPVDADNIVTFSTSFDEQPYSRFKMYNGVLTTSTDTALGAVANSGTQNYQSVINSMMTKKILGYKDLVDIPAVQGVMIPQTNVNPGNSPDQNFYWNIEAKSLVLRPPASTSTTFVLSSMAVKVDIYYKVQLINRRALVDSGNDQEA